MENNKKNQLNIDLPETVADGVYSNLAIISHSPTEFVVDFAQIVPAMQKAKVRSRVIMTPQNAKRLFKALADNLKKYEQNFGPIKDVNDTIAPFAMGSGTAGEA
ncbi:MAG: DUF3467 domain-containing protein [Bacteroidales bacterium]|nr:DUF3467 domain-containing protein [Bacteroidales bacterium]